MDLFCFTDFTFCGIILIMASAIIYKEVYSMENFTLRLKLAQLNRPLQQVLQTFVEPTTIKSVMMTAEVQPIDKSDKKNILVQISLLPDIRVNIHVTVDSIREMSLIATKYNMAIAQGCAVSFGLGNDCSLVITLIPPNEKTYKKLQEFFDLFCQL